MKILCTGGSGFIGTHLLDSLIDSGLDLINIDIAKPKKSAHSEYWRKCNILDLDGLKKIFLDYRPSHVVHLAARATMQGKSLDDFRDNTIGTANLLDAVKSTPGVSRVVVTSSQHVRKPGSGIPKNDLDFVPHGLYGESKVITEQFTREADLSCCWTIIRPTTVWGPWHPFLPTGLWRLMRKGLYFHPYKDSVIRSYGYVKNVVWQIEKILTSSESLVQGKVYYLGEESVRQVEWIDAFSEALSGRTVLQVPKEFIHALAIAGDVLRFFGMKFPMDSQRYFNLTTTNPVSITPALNAFGIPPYSMQTGIEETVGWLKKQGYR